MRIPSTDLQESSHHSFVSSENLCDRNTGRFGKFAYDKRLASTIKGYAR
jgi:hypothetical protein